MVCNFLLTELLSLNASFCREIKLSALTALMVEALPFTELRVFSALP